MNFIVITSINAPTEAVYAFSRLRNYRLIVAGDKKTPNDWFCHEAFFLSFDDQLHLGRHLNKVLPYNHYCRKMMGYLFAIERGAQCIVDTDDDNIPKTDWDFPSFDGEFNAVKENLGFINIYQYFTSQKIWPRGLPLKTIRRVFDFKKIITEAECKVGVWQGLADEDPDVDAIYRLIDNTPCFFEYRAPIVLKQGTLCPFNTQNTIVRRELFPLLYLPTYVNFRFTDILRGLVAQPIMWLYGYNLGFTRATVIQKRNPHDYFEDFISEIPMYQYSEKIIEVIENAIKKECTLTDNLLSAYESLLNAGIVEKKEIGVLSAWLKDLELAGFNDVQ